MTATLTATRRGPAPQPRLPLEPLMRAAGADNQCHLARMTGAHRTAIARAAKDGITHWMADRWACAVGLHPVEVWPEFIPDVAIRFTGRRPKLAPRLATLDDADTEP
jgi:hypothetical protein